MKKNECAQEMILNLVMRDGCEVKLLPVFGNEKALRIVIQRRGLASDTVIDLELTGLFQERQEEMVCREIERAAMELFRFQYRGMMKKHFHKED